MSRLQHLESKIHDRDTLRKIIAGWKVKSNTTVFTNGVFDLLHRGHVTLLAQAADFGDKLIVGLNSDVSTKALGKGPDRPVSAEDDRAMVIAALQMVDAVVIFDESTPLELIRELEPDVLVKGGDYDPLETDSDKPTYIVGSDLQRAAERRVETVSTVEGYSTTSIIEKSRRGQG